MYALVKDGKIVAYPYNVDQLRRDNPNTSFPKTLSKEVLEHFGVFLVLASTPPDTTYFQTFKEITPVFSEGEWRAAFEVVDMTEEEVSARRESLAHDVRIKRALLIAESDWTQGKDIPSEVSEPWAVYRQQLRDITEQENFPWEVIWPEPPAT
jgi:hypothetical protein